jgi:hypothetical protein
MVSSHPVRHQLSQRRCQRDGPLAVRRRLSLASRYAVRALRPIATTNTVMRSAGEATVHFYP